MQATRILASVALLAALISSEAGHAAECKLTEIASIDLTTSPSGVPLVPAKLNGVDEKLWLDLEDPFSYLAPDIGSAVGAQQTDVPSPFAGFVPNGSPLRELAFHGHFRASTVQTVQIGTLIGKDIQMYSGPDSRSMAGVAGAIGLNLLANYDVELDLSKNKLNLFDKGHCPGQVIYWTKNSPVGVVDIMPMAGGANQYVFSLDGDSLGAFIAADSMDTTFSFVVAREDFKLTHDSTGVTLAKTIEDGTKLYRYPFKALGADGLTISNPEVYLVGDEYMDKICDGRLHARTMDNSPYNCRGDADLTIGVHELRALHLFFAFSEHKLYVTAAGAN